MSLRGIDTTGGDFERIWRDIEEFENWLLAHPDQRDRLPEIYVPGTEIHGQTDSLLADLVEREAIMIVADYEVLGVELVDRPDPDTAIVHYTDTRSHREVIEVASGAVLEREEYEDQPWSWELRLERSDRGSWRISSIEFLEDV
ncbi:MAG: hypothetical protein U5R31_15960 [Acidimicrobiia bacterium]|nr:hypothetical protein [Acidimicrobiia bacterium]